MLRRRGIAFSVRRGRRTLPRKTKNAPKYAKGILRGARRGTTQRFISWKPITGRAPNSTEHIIFHVGVLLSLCGTPRRRTLPGKARGRGSAFLFGYCAATFTKRTYALTPAARSLKTFRDCYSSARADKILPPLMVSQNKKFVKYCLKN